MLRIRFGIFEDYASGKILDDVKKAEQLILRYIQTGDTITNWN
jgi:hypothetical protein